MMIAADDPSWKHYKDTRLEFLEERSVSIDVSSPVDPEALAVLQARGIGPAFAVITAQNPRGRAVNEAMNRELTDRLKADVIATAPAWVMADGVSLDGLHRERGFAVLLSKAAATALAVRYDQSAFFWFDGETMWIVGALVATPDIRLPA